MKILISLLTFFSLAPAYGKLQIVTTTTDLGSLVEEIGGSDITTWAIVKGTQDPHQIEAKPSFMVRMRDADLVVAHGLELETAWLKPLIEGARNVKIAMASNGYLELGEHLEPLGVAHAAVSRAQGDVHPGGNPHFQLDPTRMGKSAVLIAERMGELDSAHAAVFKTRAEALQKRLDQKTTEWKARLQKAGIKEIVTYHKTFDYFCDRFSIKCDIQLEPRPGIPPTASHLLDVIADIKKRHIPLVLIENYFDEDAADKLKSEVPGLRIFRVPVSVLGSPSVKTSDELIENLVRVFEGKPSE